MDVLAYKAYGDEGIAVYGHIIGTPYTFAMSYAEYDWSGPNWIAQAGGGIIYRGRNVINTYDDALVFNTGDPNSSVLLLNDSQGHLLEDIKGFGELSGNGLFVAQTDENPGTNSLDKRLYKTDGVSAPVDLLGFEIQPMNSNSDNYFVTIGNFTYFRREDTNDIWRVDINGNATLLIDTENSSSPYNTVGFSYRFQFQGDIIFDGSSNGHHLYRLDTDTGLVSQLIDTGSNSGQIFYGFGVGDTKYYYFKHTSATGFELYVSNGIISTLVEDINPGNGHSLSNSKAKATIGDRLIFVANDGVREELWVSDGTAAGTFAITGAVGLTNLKFTSTIMTALGNKVIFVASHPSTGYEIYATDGTAAGTVFLADTGSSSTIQSWEIHNGLLYIGYRNGDRDNIWVTDGTVAGTGIAASHLTENWPNNTRVEGMNVVDIAAANLPTLTQTGTSSAETIFGTFLDEVLDLLDGNDLAYGLAGDDTILGGGGRDYISGGGGRDAIHGGDKGDFIFGNNGNDFIDPGAGADQIDGGNGYDRVWYGNSTVGVTVDLLSGVGFNGDAQNDTYVKIERITGSDHNDILIGNAVANSIKGGDGDDLLFGKGGRDIIEGQKGDDVLYGGAANDILLGGKGDDVLYGNSGFDRLNGGRNDDELTGGADADYFVFKTENSYGFGYDIIRDFENGVDRIDVRHVHSVGNPANIADSFSDFSVSASGIGVKVKFETGQVIYLDDTNGINVADIDASDFIFA